MKINVAPELVCYRASHRMDVRQERIELSAFIRRVEGREDPEGGGLEDREVYEYEEESFMETFKHLFSIKKFCAGLILCALIDYCTVIYYLGKLDVFSEWLDYLKFMFHRNIVDSILWVIVSISGACFLGHLIF